jgi:hypothetical protein
MTLGRISWLALGALVLGSGCSGGDGPLAPGPGGGTAGAIEEAGGTQKPIKQLEGGSSPGSGNAPAPFVPGQAVVNVAETAGVDLATLNARWRTTTVRELEDGQYAVVQVPTGEDVWSLCGEMLESGDCDVAQPNYELEAPEVNHGVVAFVETDHVFSDVADQSALSRIGVPVAHLQSTGAGAVVAILDTGVDLAHADLAGAFLPGWDFVDDDADPTDAADGIDQDGDGLTDEGAGHGTHVAGIVHAVAPAAMLLPVRVMDSEGMGNSVGIARGIRWAVDHGADVINLSLGMVTDAYVIKDAVDYADNRRVLVVASAGNQGIQESHHFPARMSSVIAVAATNANDLKAPFSNYGSYVNVSAPGEAILSTFPGGGYAVWSGTSFSAPMVSGGAALWYQKHPWGGPSAATDAVEETARQLDYPGQPYDGKLGEGRLDVAALVMQSGIGN